MMMVPYCVYLNFDSGTRLSRKITKRYFQVIWKLLLKISKKN